MAILYKQTILGGMYEMRLKKVGVLLLSAVMTMQLMACAGTSTKGDTKDTITTTEDKTSDDTSKKEDVKEEAKEEVTITIWHQSVTDTDPVKKIIEDSVEDYKKLHPNVTIVQEGVTGEQYKTKIKTAFAAGEAPDISYMFGGGSFVKPYIDAGYLLPIDEYLTSDVKEKILDGMLENCTYNGKIYTFPTITFLANLYCNTEMFEKAGATYPTTWTELLDAVDKLKAAGYNPIILGEKDRWPGMYWFDIISARQVGNPAIMEAFKDPTKFNSEGFVKAAEKMQELVNAGAFNQTMLSMSYDEMVSGFAAGQGAMLFQANWIHPNFENEDAVTNGKVKAIAFPIIEGAAGTATEFSGGSSDGYYINANTKHPKEAYEYLAYLSERIGIEGYEAGAGLPCWDASSVDASKLSPLSQQSAQLMETGTSYITWWDNILSADDSESYKNLVAELLALKITPQEFAEKMSKLQPSELY